MMRYRAIVILAGGMLAATADTAVADSAPGTNDVMAELAPFTSDGCSEFPDGTRTQQQLWLDCCTAHDRAYWLGGTYAERQAADKSLEQCVAQVGQPEIALVMLAGVRVGGSPFWPTRFRWGYGWSYLDGWLPRGYRPLTDTERDAAARLLNADSGLGTGDD